MKNNITNINKISSSRSKKPTIVRSGKSLEGLGIYPYIDEIFNAIRDESMQVINVFAPTGMGKSVGISAFWYINNMHKEIGRRMFFSIPTVIGVRKMHTFLTEKFTTDNIGYSANRQHSNNYKKAEVCLYTTQSLTNHLMLMYNTHNDMSDVFVVIDEAHHTSYENQVLMKYCDWLISHKKKLRVLITTATPNFSNYINMKPSIVFNIQGESNDSFADSLTKKIEICYAESSPYIPSAKHGQFIIDIDNAIIQTVNTLKKALCEHKDGHVLIFVPGEPEGVRCMEVASQNIQSDDIEFHMLCSNLSDDDMLKITEKENGKRKVIFSTNIAESSITINNLTVVVDMLLQKERVLHQNALAVSPALVISTNVIPIDSSIQRRGRVGRTQVGYYYPICDQHFFTMMRSQNVPVYHLNDKLNSAMNFLCNKLPADDILQLDPDEFKVIMEILRKHDLFCFETNTIKPNGQQISRMNLPIDTAIFLIEYCNKRSYLDCLVPIALISMVSARDMVSSIFYFSPIERTTMNINDKYVAIVARCQQFAGRDLFFDSLIRAWASYKSSDKPLSEWCLSHSFNTRFFKTSMNIFNRLCKELKPDVSIANWNDAWIELSQLFCTNDLDYTEIYQYLKQSYPLVLKHKKGDTYIDNDGTEYQLDKLRITNIYPQTISVVSVYSYLSTKKVKGITNNVQRNIISFAF